LIVALKKALHLKKVVRARMSRKRRRNGDFNKFILLPLLKEGPLYLCKLEKMMSVLVSQFEIIGTESGTRIVSSLFSKLGRPAIIRQRRKKRERSKQQIDLKLECHDLQEKRLIKTKMVNSNSPQKEQKKQKNYFYSNSLYGLDDEKGCAWWSGPRSL
jgi:hypothetical protein